MAEISQTLGRKREVLFARQMGKKKRPLQPERRRERKLREDERGKYLEEEDDTEAKC
jgi:hypothetical protein